MNDVGCDYIPIPCHFFIWNCRPSYLAQNFIVAQTLASFSQAVNHHHDSHPGVDTQNDPQRFHRLLIPQVTLSRIPRTPELSKIKDAFPLISLVSCDVLNSLRVYQISQQPVQRSKSKHVDAQLTRSILVLAPTVSTPNSSMSLSVNFATSSGDMPAKHFSYLCSLKALSHFGNHLGSLEL